VKKEKMKTIDYLQQVINHIESHVTEELSLESIGNEVGFSKFYLNRLFSVYTGLSIMEYVRKRKLNYAMAELKTKARLIDIALNYGYSCERSFSRAFIKEFKKSPSYFRNHSLALSPKLILSDLTLFRSEDSAIELLEKNTTLSPRIQKEGVKKMLDYLSNVKYITLKEMSVLSATQISHNPEEEIIGSMKQLASSIGIHPVREFGFDSPVEQELAEQGIRGYEYWLVYSEKDEELVLNFCKQQNLTYELDGYFLFGTTPVEVKAIPTYRYASLRIKDPFDAPFERIPLGWKALVQWLETNPTNQTDLFEHTSSNIHLYCLEEVIEIDGITYMDIFIPIDRG
jgi:AraC family transcriptional regulator